MNTYIQPNVLKHVTFLNSLSEKLNEDILKLEATIYKEADVEFNLASPKQLGDVLFDHLKLVDKPKKTRRGKKSKTYFDNGGNLIELDSEFGVKYYDWIMTKFSSNKLTQKELDIVNNKFSALFDKLGYVKYDKNCLN